MNLALLGVAGCILVMPALSWGFTLRGDERLVPSTYRAIAVQEKVPSKILYAIAMAESGYRAPNGQHRPWPWTLNIAGDSRRYKNRSQTILALSTLISSGKRNIDIGIAQINYHWNNNIFKSLSHAVDPVENLRMAAHVLKRELKKCKSQDWWCAVGRYHSPGKRDDQKQRASVYRDRVRMIWDQLL